MARRGINRVIVLGTLGKDPEVRYMPNGDAVTNISVATSESWVDKNTGEKHEKTEWHRIVFFKKLAEIVGEYLRKGSKIYLEGKLQTRKWQAQDGSDRYTTEIVAHDMQMLDKKEDQPSDQAPQQNSQPEQSSSAPRSTAADEFEDDIPF